MPKLPARVRGMSSHCRGVLAGWWEQETRKEEEEAATKKRLGTPVTRENFAEWWRQFKLERDGEAKTEERKPTGNGCCVYPTARGDMQ